MSSYLERNPLLYPLEPSAPAARHYVVIPVFDENESIGRTLSALKSALQHAPEPVAVVLVLNEPADCSVQAQAADRELLTSLQKNDGKYDGGLSIGRELFYINLLDSEIKEKFRTVGNARKVGFDSVIAQSDGKVTDKKSWLFSLDADTLMDENYLSCALAWAQSHPQAAGAVFAFNHRCESPEPAVNIAAMRYEIFLLDYAVKLRSCGSAYGFWTIGSAFMCNAADYMRCGGMRRHAAGEDFYFLQALRKVGAVEIIPDCWVYPAGRLSGRVPFGTGPAIAGQLAGKDIELYAAESFELLRKFFHQAAVSSYDQLANGVMELATDHLQKFFNELNFAEIWQRIVRNTPKNHAALHQALHIYCDGFFILKFCHWLEDKYPQKFARQKLLQNDPQELQTLLKNLQDALELQPRGNALKSL